MNLTIIFALIALIMLIIFLYSPKKRVSLKAGDKAPAFTLLDENGTQRSLDEFKGHKVVLYFYPKDNTPGCILEACGLRDNYAPFKENNIVVIGISYDSPISHKVFKEKQKLPFILLSDTEKRVAKKYGAYVSALNNLYPERKTFLINQAGIIIKIFDEVDVTTHANDILTALGLPAKQ